MRHRGVRSRLVYGEKARGCGRRRPAARDSSFAALSTGAPAPMTGKPAASDHLPALPDERGNGKGDLKSGFSADYKNFEEDFYEREPIGLSLCKRSAEQGPGLPEQPAAGGGVYPDQHCAAGFQVHQIFSLFLGGTLPLRSQRDALRRVYAR